MYLYCVDCRNRLQLVCFILKQPIPSIFQWIAPTKGSVQYMCVAQSTVDRSCHQTLPPPCKPRLRSSGMLHRVDKQMVTTVFEKPFGRISKG